VRTVRVDSGGRAGTAPTGARSMTDPPQALDQKDVLTGDTIIAFFRDSLAADSARGAAPRDSVRLAGRPVAPAPAAARGDTAKTEIERLLAIGNAHSLYRMRDSTQAAEQKPGINYLIGDRIDLTFKGGEVDVARVRGLKQGMYLDPGNPADSTAADTTAAGRRAATNAGRRQPAARPGARPASGLTPATTAAPPAQPRPSQPRPPTRELPEISASGRRGATLASRAAPAGGGRT
jgi:hypothetical protein